jgi:hypothetical protein
MTEEALGRRRILLNEVVEALEAASGPVEVESTHEPERNAAFLGRRGARFGLVPAYIEATGVVEGKSFRVLGLDADPLLARTLGTLLLSDRIEEEGADPFAAARRVEVEDEDLADAGTGHATAAGADHGVVLYRDDPAVPAFAGSDLAPDPLGL